MEQILWFKDINLADLGSVGGKNSSLGEIVQSLTAQGINVPDGFAVSADVYRAFIESNNLSAPVAAALASLKSGQKTLQETGATIRNLIEGGEFSDSQALAITAAYQELGADPAGQGCDVAVRSSATAEDLPEASFAGQQESYLNVNGNTSLLGACRSCYASLYTDRAIAYREEQGFAHESVAISVGVQKMVRSDRGAAGVMFTLDTETGFPDAVVINGAWGLGESVVKGLVTPDAFMVYKPLLENTSYVPIIGREAGSKLSKLVYADNERDYDESTITLETTEDERKSFVLSDEEILQLARWAVCIECHYQRPMDIEWAKDGITGELFIVQARPETVESQRDRSVLEQYTLNEKSELLVEGASVGSAIATGKVCYLSSPDSISEFPDGAILVANRTDPDWVPVMRRAAGIITDSGGPTSHAAIVSRELKVPAIVGCGDATSRLQPGEEVTLSCAEGAHGRVYKGKLEFSTSSVRLDEIPATKTDIMINVAMPDGALRWWQLPVAGIGLTRIEFIISGLIGVHPMALLHPERIADVSVLEKINEITAMAPSKEEYFVDELALGISTIAASQYPKPVIVRMSDFKSNEYRGLLGGEFFELQEENPMLGLRGASRYYNPLYREAFKLECAAIKKVRETMGLANVIVMIPFCRTPGEADRVQEVMAEAGLVRGVNGLEVYVMCEIPSNIILAEEFAERFDGFSIGSNDLTQLVLGIDRDSHELSYLFDARNEAVKKMIASVIKTARGKGRKVGICGQAPSDHPEFAAFLVAQGIDSISLNPDSVVEAAGKVADAES